MNGGVVFLRRRSSQQSEKRLNHAWDCRLWRRDAVPRRSSGRTSSMSERNSTHERDSMPMVPLHRGTITYRFAGRLGLAPVPPVVSPAAALSAPSAGHTLCRGTGRGRGTDCDGDCDCLIVIIVEGETPLLPIDDGDCEGDGG